MNFLDMSDPGQVTHEWSERQIRRGWGGLSLCLWTGNRTPGGPQLVQRALRTWRECGGVTAGYFVVHDWPNPDSEEPKALRHFEAARLAAGGANGPGGEWDHLRWVAVDVEIEPVTASTILEAAGYITNDGLRPVVYSGAWFWPEVGGRAGHLHAVSQLPAWVSDTTGNIPDLAAWRRFAGWTEAVGKQYATGVLLDGVEVDLNVFSDTFTN
jgi:hypothetical protein